MEPSVYQAQLFSRVSKHWQAKAALSQQTVAATATVQSGTVLVVGQKRDKFWSIGLSSSPICVKGELDADSIFRGAKLGDWRGSR